MTTEHALRTGESAPDRRVVRFHSGNLFFITFAKRPDLSSTLRVKGPNLSPSTRAGTDAVLHRDAGYRESTKAHDPKNQPRNICGPSLNIGREAAAIPISR